MFNKFVLRVRLEARRKSIKHEMLSHVLHCDTRKALDRTCICETSSEKSREDRIERKITSQLAITFSSAVTDALY